MPLFVFPKFSTLTKPDDNPALQRFWLLCSLAFVVLYSYLGLRQAFASEYIVQDDVRQHVFWMWRFVDPELLPNDLITDYFQSVVPAGYTALYKVMAMLGIHPILFSKILGISEAEAAVLWYTTRSQSNSTVTEKRARDEIYVIRMYFQGKVTRVFIIILLCGEMQGNLKMRIVNVLR